MQWCLNSIWDGCDWFGASGRFIFWTWSRRLTRFFKQMSHIAILVVVVVLEGKIEAEETFVTVVDAVGGAGAILQRSALRAVSIMVPIQPQITIGNPRQYLYSSLLLGLFNVNFFTKFSVSVQVRFCEFFQVRMASFLISN